MIFYSKRDLWLGLLLFVPTGVSTFAMLLDLGITFSSLIMILVFAFISWLWFGTYYLIERKKIYIRSGPFRKTVLIENIRSINDTRNCFSAPALSLDRIEIKGEGIYILISPKLKLKFVEKLLEVNDKIEYNS